MISSCIRRLHTACPTAVAAVAKSVGLRVNRVLVNFAGVVGPSSTKIVDYSLLEFDRVCSVNLRESFIMTKVVLPLVRKYGRILPIASIAGKEGNTRMCGYSATKSEVIGLVKSVGKEYADTGVTVNSLAPAVVMLGTACSG
jgi:2-dehydro-3-deoxy-L-rhamnonate dehydrogenase (NAD+)